MGWETESVRGVEWAGVWVRRLVWAWEQDLAPALA